MYLAIIAKALVFNKLEWSTNMVKINIENQHVKTPRENPCPHIFDYDKIAPAVEFVIVFINMVVV
jgi:hypothetical protein